MRKINFINNFNEDRICDCLIESQNLSLESFAGRLFDNVHFKNCSFTNSFFYKMHGENLKFTNCSFINGNFLAADFLNVLFLNCILNEVNFQRLDGASLTFRNCKLKSINFSYANLYETRFVNSQIIKIDFRSSDIDDLVIKNSTFQFIDAHGAKIGCNDIVSEKFGKILTTVSSPKVFCSKKPTFKGLDEFYTLLFSEVHENLIIIPRLIWFIIVAYIILLLINKVVNL